MQSPLSFLRASRVHVAVVLVAALVVAGCATRRPVPVEERTLSRNAPPPRAATPVEPAPNALAPGEAPPAATYTVKRGDTLHQIALDNGLDYRELAAWNNIENVNRIFPGQALRLTAPGEAPPTAVAQEGPGAGGVITAPLRAAPPVVAGAPAMLPPAAPPGANASPAAPAAGGVANVKTSPKAIKEPYSEQAVRDLNLAASAGPAPASAVAPASSRAPVEAKPDANAAVPPTHAGLASGTPAPVTPSTSTTAANADQLDWSWPAKGRIVTSFSETANLKGIDIAGTAGEPVRASAAGRVVYAGNGLRGYGKLIIIKHNNTYLSAYAHNRDLLVKEGQQVTRGQKIAEMGSTDADQVKLHFEIRRHGKPMDPTKFLPPT
jgi:lipoprotein NlpD